MIFELIRHKQGCNRLILIFTGWSTTPDIYRNTTVDGWDVAVVYDYSDMNFDVDLLEGYSTIWLFAWSLGITAASTALSSDKIAAAFAINGTLNPVSDFEGIPTAIYEGTITNLDQKNLSKFLRRMSPDAETFKKLFDKPFTDDDILNLRTQLILLREASQSKHKTLPWRKAFISNGDRIFPAENMKRSWKKHNVEIIETEGAHYISLEKIIKAVIPDTKRIASKFHSALTHYDNHAVAQERVAERLNSMIAENFSNSDPSVLEIGPGSGLLTRKYYSHIWPAEIDFLELFPITPFNLAKNEKYFCGNAETLIESIDKKYDLILSASTVQWFANIPAFISNCRRHLKQGGVMAISSFIEGNLSELDAYRPSPLHYYSEEDYRNWMEREFSTYIIETGEIPVKFRNKRELLMHLKYTGVTAAGNISTSPLSLPDTLTTLTYRPILIIAKV